MTTEVTMTPAAQEFAARLGAAGCGSDPAVVDAILELVPHLFGSNRRPTGQRGALLWFRTGSNVVVPQAFRLRSLETRVLKELGRCQARQMNN